ncbi:MAG: hypothetical protein OZ921_12790, partial [Sorangiineae bacterium]|nr:hypothetical protein [Sorangiineae bacterium]
MKPLVALVVCALALLASSPARAEPPADPSELFATGVAAIHRGAWDEAIDDFELLADRGFVHPDASFDRAVAYLGRARSKRVQPGDLGHAAAALAETLELRPGDTAAEESLTRVREEIARRRASEGAHAVTTHPSLARALVGLVGEDTWSLAAALGSLLLAAGLATRRLGRAPQLRLGGALSTAVGMVVLPAAGALAATARHYRLTSEPAVVVASEARLLDSRGQPARGARGDAPSEIPEGASVVGL